MTFLRTSVVALCLLVCASILHGQSNVKTISVTFTTIDVPGAVYTGASGINKSGEIVGGYGQDPSNDAHGFLYNNGLFTYFDYPDGQNWTIPLGINDSGLVVGHADQDPVVGFLYDGTTFSTLRDGNDDATFSSGINNTGIVVGGAGTIYTTKGFEMKNGRYRAINFPGSYTYASASGINNFGVVAGWTDTLGYLYQHGKFQTIAFPGATRTTAWGINDGSIVVGWYYSASCNCAFAYKAGKYLSFNYPGAVLTAAEGINVSGQIVGQYTLDYVTYHGFVTSPITAKDFR